MTRPSPYTLLIAGAGFTCWMIAQTLLLTSRHPVAPLILFALGFILLHPMLIFHERRWQTTPDEPPNLNQPMWLNWRTIYRDHPREIAAVLALTVLAALIQITTPSPFNIRLFFSSLWVVLLVPATFWLAYVHLDAQVGVIAAGFAAVSGWALALGRVDSTYAGIALISAVYIVALEHSWRTKKPLPFIILPMIGLLTSPLFVYPILLLPVRVGLQRLDDRRSLKHVLIGFAGGVAVAGVFIIPRLATTPTPPPYANPVGNPQYTFTEALTNSLLMFNLTSDPNPLHGIVNQPAFSPVLAAAFLVGLVGLAWKINTRRRWLDSFLVWALVITLLPSALLLNPPVSYPDLQQAAMALPVALVIAAFGASLFVRLITERLGVFFATAIIVIALAITLIDVRQHYTTVFIPTYENITFRQP